MSETAGGLPSRGLTPLNVDEAATPRDIERRLAELYNDAIRAEMLRRQRAADYRHAAAELRKARLQTATDPQCPVVSTSPRVTVAQRETWIETRISAQIEDVKLTEGLLEDAMAYVRFIESQTGKIQTLSKLVMRAYGLPDSVVGGR